MYVFGGSLYPSEAITAEFWKLNLTSMEWTPLFNVSIDNSIEQEFDNSTEAEPLSPPVPVRGHTAHVVGSKMVVLLGLSHGRENFPVYVQEYDFGESLSSQSRITLGHIISFNFTTILL